MHIPLCVKDMFVRVCLGVFDEMGDADTGDIDCKQLFSTDECLQKLFNSYRDAALAMLLQQPARARPACAGPPPPGLVSPPTLNGYYLM